VGDVPGLEGCDGAIVVTIEMEHTRAGCRGRAGLEPRLESHRRELRRHCQRMLGSAFEADDAVQETLVRAWRRYEQFDGRASLRSWLYRIATNVCLDMLRGRQRQARPMDLAPGRSDPGPGAVREPMQPVTSGRGEPPQGDPADLVASREAVRDAFVVALRRLPSRQRAVLILREVLRWRADEVAELLDCTTASVNSALQRARAALAAEAEATEGSGPRSAGGDVDWRLLARYVDAFERSDVQSLVSLLRLDHHGRAETAA
jgi:RNA polymerase sigma-70 factor (ECF subfamily)